MVLKERVRNRRDEKGEGRDKYSFYLKTALAGEEVSIVCGLKMELQVLQSLTLDQVQVVVLAQYS